MADESTIDDVVNNSGAGASGGLLVSLADDIATWVGYAKTGFMYSTLAVGSVVSCFISGLAGPVTAGALMLGKILVDYKNEVKTKWEALYTEGFKGLLLGTMAKFFYEYVVNVIPNNTIIGKVGRTLAYNPGFLGGAYNPTYLAASSMMDDEDWKEGDWWDLTKKTFTNMSPLHFLTTNYIGGVQGQVAASALLATGYRYIAG